MILQVCAYGAEYSGNFIASLEALEKRLEIEGVRTIYVFVERARKMAWCQAIERRTKVYYLPEAKARIKPQTYYLFRKIYRENDIDIVHSHFELYDIPATIMAPKKTRIFWHLHDPINSGYGLRKILWKIQYSIVGKRAQLLSVSDHYRKVAVQMGFPEAQTHTILNSIDLDRVCDNSILIDKPDKQYDFLTFGWDFLRKGDDLILQACNRLEREGYHFKLLLNGNDKTWPELEQFLHGQEPAYLVRGTPVEDVSSLFVVSKVFIQASRRETFSYAVCEAAYAGLPVISSDISGLEWAHELPTVDFFCAEDSDELYKLMKSYLDGKHKSTDEKNASKKIIYERYSLDVWVKQILVFYNL